MKKFLLLSFITALLNSEELSYNLDDSILSNDYNQLFTAELLKNTKEKDFDKLSWVSPVNISLSRSWSKNYVLDKYSRVDKLNIGIDQPIFRFGGIYYGIKLSDAKYNLGKIKIYKQKHELASNAFELALRIKQSKLTISKLKLQLVNSNIEIKSITELFEAGLADSTDLDNAIAKKTQADLSLLDLKSNLEQLKASFRKISSQDINSVKVPKFNLITKDEFLNSNYETKIANANALLTQESVRVTRAKYYPSIVAGAHYSKTLSKKLPNIPSKSLNYSLSISVPLSVNMNNDIEIAKYNRLIAKLNSRISSKNSEIEYNLFKRKIKIYDQKIAFAHKEAKLYKKLLKSTKDLYRAGQKSINDVKLLKNSLRMKNLDAKIYNIEKELELLNLHKRVGNEI